MATKQSPSIRARVFNGEYGNLSVAKGYGTFTGDAIGTVIQCIEVPAGAEIYGMDIFRAALGASTGLKVGIAYPDGDGTDDDDLFATVADSSSAGTTEYKAKPFTTPGRSIITITNTGAAATGTVDLVLKYVYSGEL